jgi:TPR repeat protein
MDERNPVWPQSHGVCLQIGKDVERDRELSAQYFRHLSDAGDSFGQFYFGICYEYGIGRWHDLREAAKYYKLSADQQNSSGQHQYGHCLEFGIGVEKDAKTAVKFTNCRLTRTMRTDSFVTAAV